MNSFRTILIPVDFTINTKIAIKKAIELAGEGTIIHLVNIHVPQIFDLFAGLQRSFMMDGINKAYSDISQKLGELKGNIEESADEVRVCTWISYESSVQSVIENKARDLGADLIIIGKHSQHSWLPFLNTVIPSIIAERTSIPVLTVKPGSIKSKARKIVVPLTSVEADKKLEVIETLCSKYRPQVFLVTFMDENKPSEFHASSLLQAFQRLKRSVRCPVEYVVLHGHNKAKEILKYAERIDADILLVNPKTETKLGWLNQRISDVLPPESRIQVLAVQSAT